MDLEDPLGLLAPHHLSEVQTLLLQRDECFLRLTNEGDVDSSGLSEQRQHAYYVLVDVREEGDLDGGGKPS